MIDLIVLMKLNFPNVTYLDSRIEELSSNRL